MMGMFGGKSILDMTDTEFEEWKAAIGRRQEYERRFRDGTRKALAEAATRPTNSWFATFRKGERG